MQVKDMTDEQLKNLIRFTLEEVLEEFFGDPDEGKELKADVKQQLIELQQRRAAGDRGIPAEDAYKKLGLHR